MGQANVYPVTIAVLDALAGGLETALPAKEDFLIYLVCAKPPVQMELYLLVITIVGVKVNVHYVNSFQLDVLLVKILLYFFTIINVLSNVHQILIQQVVNLVQTVLKAV